MDFKVLEKENRESWKKRTIYNSNGVVVTNSRFIVAGQTYAMSGVTSVKTGETYPSRKGPIILGVFGLFVMGDAWYVGLPMIGLAVYGWLKQKSVFSVSLSTAAGEVQALSSESSSYVLSIVEALNKAIIHRG